MLPDKIFLIAVMCLSVTNLTYAQDCRTGVLDVKPSHWFRQLDVESQKKALLWLGSRNSYFCERNLTGYELLTAVEETAKTEDREKLALIIDMIVDSVPTDKQEEDIALAIGDKRFHHFVDNHIVSFNPLETIVSECIKSGFPSRTWLNENFVEGNKANYGF